MAEETKKKQNTKPALKRKKKKRTPANKAAKKALTPKQEKFVQGILKGLTQTEAYKQAYDCSKMSENTIKKRASELATKNGDVKGTIEKRRTASNDRLNISTDEARKLLIEQDIAIIKANITDYVQINEDGSAKVLPLEGKNTSAIKSIRFDKSGMVTGFELEDKAKAREDLKKLLGIKEQETDTKITVSFASDDLGSMST